MNKNEDTSDLTGLPQRIPKSMKLNEVRFNGKDGKFVYVDVINRKDGEKSEKTDLGESVDFVFLRQRRRISGFHKPKNVMYISSEHNEKADNIYLFGAKEKGIAEELYNKYNVPPVKMHSERVVYAFLLRSQQERELVRIIIKGSTLNWKREGKAKTTVDYFSFVQDDKRQGHLYEYVSRMVPVKETGPLGDYYSIHFSTVAKLNADQIEKVVEKLKEIRDDVTEQDNYYKTAKKIDEKNVPTIDADDDKQLSANIDGNTVEYPTDEINPNDIPF